MIWGSFYSWELSHSMIARRFSRREHRDAPRRNLNLLKEEKRLATPLEVVRTWKERMRARDFEHMGNVVDLEGYTEICLGLTGWTTGYDIALKNYVKNMVEPWSDMRTTEEEVIEADGAVVIRQHTEATHTGEFLGVPPTGRRISWDATNIVYVKDGRVVGQWAQPDLWSIYRQIAPSA
jgi:predicted ester cyclase